MAPPSYKGVACGPRVAADGEAGMAISFYDASVATYLQGAAAVVALLDKAGAHFSAEELAALPGASLHPDMLPLRFQIRSVRHHSMGAIEGFRSGSFEPPGRGPENDFAALQAIAAETRDALAALTRDEVEALGGREVVFSNEAYRLAFTTENFLLSFSLPNFFFHAATAYDILRMKGLPLAKRDYLGKLRFNRT